MRHKHIYGLIMTLLLSGSVFAQVKIGGNVYGGCELGKVTDSTTVTINGGTTSGSVYGGGQGSDDDTKAGWVKGKTKVVLNDGTVESSIYGGGELGSVGTFTDSTLVSYTTGANAGKQVYVPKTCTSGTGLAKVLLKGGRVGRLDRALMPHTTATSDDVFGYVFCGSQGEADSINHYKAVALGVVDSTYLEISNDVLITASVYGGCENGLVLRNTHVKITGGQIGTGYYKDKTTGEDHWDGPYTETQWQTAIDKIKNGSFTAADAADFHECDHWPYKAPYAVYDIYNAAGGSDHATNGHSFFGNVFGGGSGYYPIVAGVWRRTAGRVKGNTLVEITGGHILTSIYGGNEYTDVLGTCTVNMSGGTLGVPRTLDSIAAHPVTCYLFGAGMGDPRVWANTWTNVQEVFVNVTGNAAIFGSIFGGGEEGHILGDAHVTVNGDNVLIGTWGNSYVDGNVFGGGRGFTGDALTAGTVGGNIEVNIEKGKMLGSIYGGGRLGSVGTYLVSADNANYGKFQNGDAHGYITVNIKGGTIGNGNESYYDEHTKGGNVFGGSMGRLETQAGTVSPIWPFLARAKQTQVNITGGLIKSNVYGGSELGSVRDSSIVIIDGGTIVRDVYGGGYGNADTRVTTSTIPSGSIVASPLQHAGIVKGNTLVKMKNGWVQRIIYGGGELASVGTITDSIRHAEGSHPLALSWPYKFVYAANTGNANIQVTGGRVGITGKDYMGPWSPTTGNPYDPETDHELTDDEIEEAKTDNGDLFGGSKGFAGKTYVMAHGANVNNAVVTINYANNAATPENYKDTLMANRKDCITGAVYGGSENGHVYDSTSITLTNGLVGHAVYGGGKGTGKYDPARRSKVYSLTAGKVYGNTHVHINGGYVVRNVFGGGNLASVGKGNYAGGTGDYNTAGYGEVVDLTGAYWDTIKASGHTYVDIYGGQLGMLKPSAPDSVFKDGIPYGSVFGGCRGKVQAGTTYDLNNDRFGYVNFTHVTIGEKGSATGPRIYGSVFGGAQDGHVRWDANTIVNSGEIGVDYNATTASTVMGDTDINGKNWVSRGNVFGGGSGIGTYKDGSTEKYNPIAGSVTQKVNVIVRGGTIHRNIYGGGNLASVGPPIIGNNAYTKAQTCVDVDVKVPIGQNTSAAAGYGGNVFGASRGRSENDSQTFAHCSFTDVDIDSVAYVPYNVYGGGELGSVNRDTDVDLIAGTVGAIAYTWKTATTDHTKPCDSVYHLYGGSVFGGGKGDLSNREFGLVKGNTDVAISGGQVYMNVYGGGEVASVGQRTVTYNTPGDVTSGIATIVPVNNTGLTSVTIEGGQVGPAPKHDPGYDVTVGVNGFDGLVCGGGKGIGDDPISSPNPYGQYYDFADVNATLVTVNMTGSTESNRIWGSVLGGAEDGHVLDSAKVLFQSGLIGTNGMTKSDGNIFGGGRNYSKKNYTAGRVGGNTIVDMTGGQIYGCIYGGGRFALTGVDHTGITMQDGDKHGNTKVKVQGGIVGNNTKTGNPADPDEMVIETYSTASMGSVYGGGKGDITGLEGHPAESALFVGLVKNTNVQISGTDTHVYGIVFGGGEVANVGKYSWTQSGNKISNIQVEDGTGIAQLSISGGIIGGDKARMRYQKDPYYPIYPLYNDDLGYVYGGGEGISDNPKYYDMVQVGDDNHQDDTTRLVNLMATVNETQVTVSGGWVKGSVFGGAEAGHVWGNTLVTISGGQIGAGSYADKDSLYKNNQFVNPLETTITDANALNGAYHWKYGKTVSGETVYTPYDPVLAMEDVEPTDGKSWFGNVFGGGSGWFPYFDTITGSHGQDTIRSRWNPLCGKVWGNTHVVVEGGHVLNNVYGGNESTDVGGKALVEIKGGTVGVPRTKEQIIALPTNGFVFGGGCGDPRSVFDTITIVDSTRVVITGGIVYSSVLGGAEDGHVLGHTKVVVGEQSASNPTVIGTTGFSGFDGHVFGGGMGDETNFAAGRVGGHAMVKMSKGTVLGNLYGGGYVALTGVGVNADFEAFVNNATQKYDSINHGLTQVTISGGTVGNAANSGRDLLLSDEKAGNVYGGGRGSMVDFREDDFARSANAAVHITGNPTVYGSVYGGGQKANAGHWNNYYSRYSEGTSATLVTIEGTPTIGTELEFNHDYSLANVQSQKTQYDTINEVRRISHTRTGNVYGGGQGEMRIKNGFVEGTEQGHCGLAVVDIKGTPRIRSSVFGGSEEGAVWGDTKVTIAGGTIGTENVIADSLNPTISTNLTSTYSFGSVYGGSYGSDAYKQFNLPNNASTQVVDSINNLAGRVYGNTYVEIKGGQIVGNVFGGGDLASVCDILHGAIVNGNCTVKVNGSAEIGPLDGTGLNGNVFGGGKGFLADPLELRKAFANVDSTFVTISGGKIWGSVLGGGSDSHVLGSTSVTVLAGADIGTDGLSTYDGNIFGGGRNYLNTNHTNGRVEGNINIAMSGGHIQGTIFGGGRMALSGVNQNGVFPTSDWDTIKHGNVTINVSGGEIGNGSNGGLDLLTKNDESVGDIFGSGKGDTKNYADPKAGTVTSSTITITGSPRIHGAVFGGGEMASVGHWGSDGKFIAGTGSTTVTIGAEGHPEYNPTIGTYKEFDPAYLSAYPADSIWTIYEYDGHNYTVTHTCTGNVYGGSQGDVDVTLPQWVSHARSKSSDVTIYSGTIMGDVYGGSEQGTVAGDTKVTIKGGTIGTIVNPGASNEYYFGNVYGAGYGSDDPSEDYNTASNDSISLSPNHTPIQLAGRTYGNSEVNLLGGTVRGSVFGGAAYASVGYGSKGNTTLNIGNATQGNYTVHGNFYGANNNNGTVMGNVEVHVNAGTIGNNTGLQSNVFGGGLGELTSTGGNVTVTVDSLNNVTAPIIYGDVYGGSAYGSVNDANSDKTTVNILAGSILKTAIQGNTYGGDIYGGGLGETGNINKGKVNGAITVNVGDSIHQPSVLAPATDTVLCHGYATIGNNVYGANNTGGSPQDNVTVNIFGTAHTADNRAEGGTGYAIQNVFGGGNYANYDPKDSGGSSVMKLASVNIFGCDNTVRRVFGGGDASSSPNVSTDIQGGRFDQVFGGGNGELYAANITGDVYLGIHGGQVGMSFGGSNQSGLVSGTTTIELDNNGPCGATNVDEYFCGGNYVDVVGDVDATITCSNGMHVKRLYGGCNQALIKKKSDGSGGNVRLTVLGGEYECVFGGSKGRPKTSQETNGFDAYIEGDVNLTIKGGTIDTVYGGSNIMGNVHGKIVVNIDDAGSNECPLVVHNVYGGGHDAFYAPDTLGCYPEVNILNGTISKRVKVDSNGDPILDSNNQPILECGNVFGGGFGNDATVTTHAPAYGPKVTIGSATSTHEAAVEGNVYGGGDAAEVTGSTTVQFDSRSKVTVNGDVFGGGHNAIVKGSAKVNINE